MWGSLGALLRENIPIWWEMPQVKIGLLVVAIIIFVLLTGRETCGEILSGFFKAQKDVGVLAFFKNLFSGIAGILSPICKKIGTFISENIRKIAAFITVWSLLSFSSNLFFGVDFIKIDPFNQEYGFWVPNDVAEKEDTGAIEQNSDNLGEVYGQADTGGVITTESGGYNAGTEPNVEFGVQSESQSDENSSTPSTGVEITPATPDSSLEEQKSAGSVTSVGYFPSGNVDDYVITPSMEVYYIENNKLIQLSPDGNQVTLFDGDSYYEEIYAYDIITSLNLSIPNYQSIYDQYVEDQKANTSGTALVYVDGVHLQDITYDSVEDKVYLLTIYRVNDLLSYTQAYTTNYYTFDMVNLWNVQQLSTPLYSVSAAYRGASYSPSYPRSLNSADLNVDSGEVMFSMYQNYYDSYVYKLNLATEKTSLYSETFSINNSFKNHQLSVNNTLYQFVSGGVSTFNLASEQWESINMKDSTNNQALCYAENQDKIYFMTQTSLFSLENVGTNRLESMEVLALSDLSVEDKLTLGDIECFFFDSAGDIIFADSRNGLLRKITLN